MRARAHVMQNILYTRSMWQVQYFPRQHNQAAKVGMMQILHPNTPSQTWLRQTSL